MLQTPHCLDEEIEAQGLEISWSKVHSWDIIVVIISKHKSMWLTERPNNIKMSEFGAEEGLLQGQARRWVAYALKPLTPWKLSAQLFSTNWGGGVVSHCKHPRSDPLFLRSAHGQVTTFL